VFSNCNPKPETRNLKPSQGRVGMNPVCGGYAIPRLFYFNQKGG
jgi:hypothetical protein